MVFFLPASCSVITKKSNQCETKFGELSNLQCCAPEGVGQNLNMMRGYLEKTATLSDFRSLSTMPLRCKAAPTTSTVARELSRTVGIGNKRINDMTEVMTEILLKGDRTARSSV